MRVSTMTTPPPRVAAPPVMPEPALDPSQFNFKPEEFTGSTFTTSNLGMFDVTEFTAIINPPESGILAIGAVRKVPVVKDDQIRVGHRMSVTLSSDHRVVDGAKGAQFLQTFKSMLEDPLRLMV